MRTIVWIHFFANWKKTVNHYVFYPCHEVILNFKAILAVNLVNVILQLLKAQCVSLFKSTVSFIFHLQTLIRKMDEVVFVL